jgi:acyl-lipid omega-6 desaturase (Delta-12 desaturase)
MAAEAIHDIRHLEPLLAPFRRASAARALLQLTTTGALYLGVWWAMARSLEISYWITLPLGVVQGALTVRLFMFFHDCVHGSFFASPGANQLVGRILGLFTLTPFRCWRRNHLLHHATTGNLDRRGHGDVDTWTVKEYAAHSRPARLLYRLSRNPIVYLLVGPLFLFLMRHRLPIGMPRSWKSEWSSVLWNDLAIVAVVAALAGTIGIPSFLMLYAPVFFVSTVAGIWLFYVQHQFDATYWRREPEWDWFEACVAGSSRLDLPAPLRWVTANIGLHDLHHLCSAIPNYRLRPCVRAVTGLPPARRVTLRRSFRFAKLALWDEDERRLVSIRDATERIPVNAPAR